MTAVTMGKALNLALHDALRDDPRVLIFGEDVGKLGGVFRVTDGLQDEFGAERVFDTPLAEATIAATALGLAIKGFRPVAEMQFDAFSYPSFQQVTSNIAKYHTRTGGACPMQLVIRIPYGGNIGAIEQHSESPGDLLHPHRRAEGGLALDPSGRLCAADGGDPRSRSGDLPGAEGALLERQEIDLPLPAAAARPRARGTRGHRRDGDRLRSHGAGGAGRRLKPPKARAPRSK